MLKASCVIVALLGVPALAQAAEIAAGAGAGSGFYLGGTVGQTDLRVTIPDVDESGTSHEVGFKVIGGYSFSEYVSVEAAYYYPGEVNESEDGTTLRLNADFFQGSVIGRFPINERLSIVGRAGFSHWESKLYVSDGFSSGTLKDDDNDFNFGIGAVVRLTDYVDLRLEWDQTKLNSAIGALPLDFRLRFLQLGAIFKF